MNTKTTFNPGCTGIIQKHLSEASLREALAHLPEAEKKHVEELAKYYAISTTDVLIAKALAKELAKEDQRASTETVIQANLEIFQNAEPCDEEESPAIFDCEDCCGGGY